MVCWIDLSFGLVTNRVHLDEANFLAMTKGDFWRPHLIEINWEGVEQSPFDVLSNPPGMVWLLWPVKDLSVVWMRVWVLPWSFIGIVGSMEMYLPHRRLTTTLVVDTVQSHICVEPQFIDARDAFICLYCDWGGKAFYQDKTRPFGHSS